MEEPRTRNFTRSDTGLVEIDGVRLHTRWRMTGTQEYVVGAGAAIDGRRTNISLALYFDNLPAESAIVQELLDRIAADRGRPLAVDLGHTLHPALYCQEIRTDNSGNPSGITLTEEPVSETKNQPR